MKRWTVNRIGPQPHEVIVGIVCEAFTLGPYAAHQELGGRPMGPRGRRKLTTHVMDARRADALHREMIGTKGDKDATKAMLERWTSGDHAFYREMMHADDRRGDLSLLRRS